MENIRIISGGTELLDKVEPLWEKLNKYHESKSTHFANKFKNFKFYTRRKKFEDTNTTKLKVDLVQDVFNNTYIGYCITTINSENIGEIESLFLEKNYRGIGIGDKLMEKALSWLRKNNINKKIIGVIAGNEGALKFYEKHGFYKKVMLLEENPLGN